LTTEPYQLSHKGSNIIQAMSDCQSDPDTTDLCASRHTQSSSCGPAADSIAAFTDRELPQVEKKVSYLDIGQQEGAKVLTGGRLAEPGGELEGGYYVQPTIFEGGNHMRIFQEEIFGPVVSVTSFADYADAVKIANDTLYGLGAGVWTRDGSTAYRASRDIGGPGVDELLPRLPRPRGLRRLQAVRHRPRDPQDDAGALPADEKPPGVVLAEEARLLLEARE
jgi:hypothetical protein